MNVLIFNGSPRKNGNTATLVRRFSTHFLNTVTIVDAYEANISPCNECGHCTKKPGCSIKDDMQKVYQEIAEADCIVIASPIHFTELTGRLLCVMSRLQKYYSKKIFRKTIPIAKSKIGGLILTGGGDGTPESAIKTGTVLLHQMNTKIVYPPIVYHASDLLPAEEDPEILQRIDLFAEWCKRTHPLDRDETD